MQRRLAAILAADVVGYSRLMDENEDATLSALQDLRSRFLEPTIDSFRGIIVKRMGDGWLVEFASVHDAFRCAIQMQRDLGDHELIKMRMAIHIGDIVHDGEDIYGTGVNVAARLEAIAEPGGICISGKVFDDVKRMPDVVFLDGGEQRLKNIQDPVKIYHIDLHNRRDLVGEPDRFENAGNEDEKSRVLVQPLELTGGDDSLVALVQGLRLGIVDGLARSNALTVASNSEEKPKFVLVGTARAMGQRLRLTFSLDDMENAEQVWSERYDRTVDDIFELEDEISQAVVYNARIRLIHAKSRHLEHRINATLSGPELLTKAAGYTSRGYKFFDQAEDATTLALQKIPNSSMAHALMAVIKLVKADFSPMALPASIEAEIDTHVNRSLILDGAGFFEHLVKAIVEGDLRQDQKAAKIHAELALRINPQLVPARVVLAVANCQLSGHDSDLDSLRGLLDVDPLGPHRPRNDRELAVCLLMLGRDIEAAEVMRTLMAQWPELRRNELVFAAALALSGELALAETCVRPLLGDYPELSTDTMRPFPICDPAAEDRIVGALIASGLPKD